MRLLDHYLMTCINFVDSYLPQGMRQLTLLMVTSERIKSTMNELSRCDVLMGLVTMNDTIDLPHLICICNQLFHCG